MEQLRWRQLRQPDAANKKERCGRNAQKVAILRRPFYDTHRRCVIGCERNAHPFQGEALSVVLICDIIHRSALIRISPSSTDGAHKTEF